MSETFLAQKQGRGRVLRPAPRDEQSWRATDSFLEDLTTCCNQLGLLCWRISPKTVVARLELTRKALREDRVLRVDMQPHIVACQVEVRELQGLGGQGEAHRNVQSIGELKDSGQPLHDALGPLETEDDGASMNASRFHMTDDDGLGKQVAHPMGP